MYDVFISSTLKSDWNLRFNEFLCNLLEENNLRCFLPQRDVNAVNPKSIFDQNVGAIDDSKVILSIAVNETPIFGVEAGYAYSINKDIVFLTSDSHKMSSMLEGMQVEKIRVKDLDNLTEYSDLLMNKLLDKFK